MACEDCSINKYSKVTHFLLKIPCFLLTLYRFIDPYYWICIGFIIDGHIWDWKLWRCYISKALFILYCICVAVTCSVWLPSFCLFFFSEKIDFGYAYLCSKVSFSFNVTLFSAPSCIKTKNKNKKKPDRPFSENQEV